MGKEVPPESSMNMLVLLFWAGTTKTIKKKNG
jgi:hypothetical protein